MKFGTWDAKLCKMLGFEFQNTLFPNGIFSKPRLQMPLGTVVSITSLASSILFLSDIHDVNRM